MKNAEQFSADMTADEALRVKFREGLNKLRGDRTLQHCRSQPEGSP